MPMPLKVTPPKPCQRCGVTMNRRQFNGRWEDAAQFQTRRFCSLRCANMRDEISDKASRERATKLRKAACEQCGATSGLHVHHLDENPQNNSLSNLMTLCASCHRRWHWTNGKEASKRHVCLCRCCSQPSRKLGMCQKHYQRFRKYGDPFLTKRGNAWGVSLVCEQHGA